MFKGFRRESQPGGAARSTPASFAHLSRWEKFRWRRAANINSGLFYFRPNHGGMEILRAGSAELATRIRGDQAALQAIFLRRFRDRIELLDHSYQQFPPTPRHYDGNRESLERVNADFAHFRGAIKDTAVMRDYIARFEILPHRKTTAMFEADRITPSSPSSRSA